MKKISLAGLLLICGLASGSALPAQAATPLSGRVLLQVEERGEAWYVDPISEQRIYVTDGNAAYAALRTFGLGISHADIWKIPVGNYQSNDFTGDTDQDGLKDKVEEALGTDPQDNDTDNDGFSDSVEFANGYNPYGSGLIPVDQTLVNQLKGRILLQVESRGEAWYVNPIDGKRYYMADGESAFQLMRSFGLGITNTDLAKVPTYNGTLDCGESLTCFASAVQANIGVRGESHMLLDLGFIQADATARTEQQSAIGATRTYTSTLLRYTVNGQEYNEYNGTVTKCTYTDVDAMVAMLKRWSLGEYQSHISAGIDANGRPYSRGSGDLYDFANCVIITPTETYVIERG